MNERQRQLADQVLRSGYKGFVPLFNYIKNDEDLDMDVYKDVIAAFGSVENFYEAIKDKISVVPKSYKNVPSRVSKRPSFYKEKIWDKEKIKQFYIDCNYKGECDIDTIKEWDKKKYKVKPTRVSITREFGSLDNLYKELGIEKKNKIQWSTRSIIKAFKDANYNGEAVSSFINENKELPKVPTIVRHFGSTRAFQDEFSIKN